MKKILFLLCVVTFGYYSYAQLNVSAELRPRFEYDHGYKSLYNNDMVRNISQRTRLKFDYKKDNLVFKLSLQDVRIWGDTRTLNTADDKSSIHEAWGEIIFSDAVSLKVGRQEVIYDDHRIFGSVNWAQQGRSFDLALLKMKAGENGKIHFGVAINDNRDNITNAPYKYLQYLWYHRDYEKFNFSLLFLNNGVKGATEDKTFYGQTLGTHINVKPSEKVKLSGSLYYQFGKDKTDTKINAMEFKIDGNFKFSDQWAGTLGFEHLSGTDNNDTKNKSFNPLYGTNHKFNGWMDYFYVGNHNNSVGLNDFHLGFKYKKNKFSAGLFGHYFTSDADLRDANGKKENNLGTELDLVLGYNYQKGITFKTGLSYMFASDGMEILKGVEDDGNNMWGWIMIAINANLFKL